MQRSRLGRILSCQNHRTQSGGCDGAREAVLLIEDDADARQTFALMLEELGCSVTACEDVAQAVAQLSSGGSCDIVVTDLIMPGTSGLEFSNLLRRWSPKTPVVLVTGDQEALESAVDEGFVPLLKPFTIDQLRAVLAEALRRRD